MKPTELVRAQRPAMNGDDSCVIKTDSRHKEDNNAVLQLTASVSKRIESPIPAYSRDECLRFFEDSSMEFESTLY